jgi:hypothetical protein
LFGFTVRVDASCLLIAILVVWSLASGFFPLYYPGFSASTYWSMGVVGALGLFGSIVFHELAHSLVARRCGMEMRGITLFVFGGVVDDGHLEGIITLRDMVRLISAQLELEEGEGAWSGLPNTGQPKTMPGRDAAEVGLTREKPVSSAQR